MNRSSSPDCPFVVGSKLEDPRSFVGRRDELDTILNRMTGVQPTSINIVGDRRIGKSSLLYHFYQTYEQRLNDSSPYIVVYISLEAADCNSETGFYRTIARELLQQPKVKAKPTLSEVWSSRSLDRVSFSKGIREWKAQQVLPVVCLDKFEALLDKRQIFDRGFYDNLRALMDANALMLVIASYKNLSYYSSKHQLNSSFFNLGATRVLTGLTEMEATDLVRLPHSKQPDLDPVLTEDKQKLALQ